MKLAFFGGLYSNYLALDVAIHDAKKRGAEAMYCLGDMGAFGPHPNRVFPLLHEHDITCVQGNYDDSIGNELNDCQCGYTDPIDNYFAQISYDYTLSNTSNENKAWLRGLPTALRLEVNGKRILLCHGSPRRTNEFLWESSTSTAFLERLCNEHESDIIVGTHSGIHWYRQLSNHRHYVNAGVLGRPENDGTTDVWYAMLTLPENSRAGEVAIDFVPVHYDHARLAKEMQQEGLPEEFAKTIMTGWWTTCLEILPSKERRRGKH